MTLLTVTLDPTAVTASAARRLLDGAQILHTAGVINTRWEDFSAWELAQGMGLAAVLWDAVADDTPGALVCTVLYAQVSGATVQERLAGTDGVVDYELDAPRTDTDACHSTVMD